MNPALIWGIVFLLLLGTELMTGTFYLLMIALGAAIGGIAAFIGLDLYWQLALAGTSAAAATAILHFRRYKNPKSAIYTENKNALIDIGQRVDVVHWNADKTTKVRHRGVEWSARWVGEGAPATGSCVIQGIVGSQLQLSNQE